VNMWKIIIIGTITSLCLSLLVSCSDEIEVRGIPETENKDEFVLKGCHPIKLSSEEQDMLDSQEQFAFDIFEQLLKKENGNFVFSPFDLSVMLGMIANGLDDDSKEEIVKTQYGKLVDFNKLNSLNSYLSRELPEVDNSMEFFRYKLGRVNYPDSFNDSFKSISVELYDADLESADFANPRFLRSLNSFVSSHTGVICKTIPELILNDGLFFMDINYFKGKWTAPFDKSATTFHEFRNLDNTFSNVSMMHVKDKSFAFFSSDNCRMVKIPFGNEALSLYVFMSEEENVKKIFNETLSTNRRRNILQENYFDLAYRGGEVIFPKFEISSILSESLISALQEIGIDGIFKKGNDLSLLLNQKSTGKFPLLQANCLKFDEEGVEGEELSYDHISSCVPISPKFETFTFDRPFYFLIEEYSTGTILFMGAVRQF
ncbi:MAG: hypothetical protein K2G69_08930, partial [Muribaculaceae bacterium]|nr:hypothetical protein [Muribaculaceae bacterium]